MGSHTYDDFALNVKFSAISIYVDPENVELVSEEEKEII
jgi:flagellar biosynthesis/type III secretory pathway protein FliH